MSVLFSAMLALTLPVVPCSANAKTFTGPYKAEVARQVWSQITAIEKMHGIPKGLLHSMSLVETGQGLEGYMLPWPYTVGVNPTATKTFNMPAKARAQLAKWQSMGFTRFDVTVNGRTYKRQKGESTRRKIANAQTSKISIIKLKALQFGKRFNTPGEATTFALRLVRQGNSNLDIGLMQINWRYHKNHFVNMAQAFDPVANINYAVTYLRKHKETRDWWNSVGRYHSGTPKHAKSYIKRVYAMYRKVHRLPELS